MAPWNTLDSKFFIEVVRYNKEQFSWATWLRLFKLSSCVYESAMGLVKNVGSGLVFLGVPESLHFS